MKKILGIVGLVLVVGIGSAFVYADSPMGSVDRYGDINDEEIKEWHQERMEWRKEKLKEDVENGYMTQEEAKNWEEHLDYMEEFHRENGFMGCHGRRGRGMMRGGFSRNTNSRKQMMGW